MIIKKTVLLTGGTGLIGRETIPFLLEEGFKIYILSRSNIKSIDGVIPIKADIFNHDEIKKIMSEIKPNYLLHYAWLSTGLFNDNSNFDFLTASINLLRTFADNGGKRVVMAGTYAEYGYHNEILIETMPVEPINIYSQCKFLTYKIAKLFCENNHISFGWMRIFSAFGSENDSRRLTFYVINQLKNNQEVVIKNGNLIRDYIYAKDVAAGSVAFLNSNVEGIVNFCSGQGITIKDYVMTIANLLNKEHLVIFQENSDCGQQQYKVVGSNRRLTNEVKFIPKYTVHDAIYEIIYK
ncbi:NAD-dependent epimerase/dehydratase family protein [Orbaceae bacterium ESL0721]|nr:NAD-dependent epimerase/dehydratase family protein [Orbaceae bacterium ESL0721]